MLYEVRPNKQKVRSVTAFSDLLIRTENKCSLRTSIQICVLQLITYTLQLSAPFIVRAKIKYKHDFASISLPRTWTAIREQQWFRLDKCTLRRFSPSDFSGRKQDSMVRVRVVESNVRRAQLLIKQFSGSEYRSQTDSVHGGGPSCSQKCLLVPRIPQFRHLNYRLCLTKGFNNNQKQHPHAHNAKHKEPHCQ